jgi:general secretion pathway protein G
MKTEYPKFRFVELVIIAAVLGFISFTVIPPLTQASTEDNIVAVVSVLSHVRSQIDLYRAQHKGMLPPADTPEEFKKALTQKDRHGLGPYIKEFPVNSFNGLDIVRINSVPDQGAGSHGWHYNSKTGEFHADDSPWHANL